MYLLDTNACIALINNRSLAIRKRLEREIQGGRVFAVSSIVEFELWYGVCKSKHIEQNTRRLETFFSSGFVILDFDRQDGRIAASIRASLESQGKPIGAYDLLIAAQSIRHDLTLVTANIKEFRRVENLRYEDWDE